MHFFSRQSRRSRHDKHTFVFLETIHSGCGHLRCCLDKEEESGAEIHGDFVDNVLEKEEQTEHQCDQLGFLECHTQTEIMKEKRGSRSSRSFIPR